VTTVLIVEDQAAIRSGLRLLLDAEEDIEVVGEAGSANQAVYEAIALEPDVVLMDVAMPEGSGIDAIPKVLEAAPDAKALVLSMEDDPSSAREAFAAGASGYVLTEAADAELVAAVREVAAGGRYVHPALGARLVPADTEERHRAEEDPLSDRERELLRLVALRHTNQEIAQLLFVSVRTAEAQRTRIMEKLRLATQAELVRYALERGLLDEE
jgi:two-component system, NarL family, response regulator NreC